MENNIITATFDGGNLVYVCPRYQYDYGQILKFTDLDLPFAYEVHFSNTDQSGNSVTQIGDENGVIIPDALFLNGETIYAWVYLHSTADDGETVYKVVIPVQKRAKPTNATPTPVQQDAITQAIAALDAAVEQTAQDVIDAGQSAHDAADSAQTASDAKDAAQLAQEKAEDAQEAAENAQDAAENAQDASESAQEHAEGAASDSEAWANGTRNGIPVSLGDPAFHNNSHYWEQLSEQNAADAGWTFFDIDDSTGELIVIVSDGLQNDVSFEIDENTGELEVIVA